MSSADLASVWLESGLTTGLFGEIADIDTIWLDGTLYFAVTGRTGVELWSLTGAASPVLLTSQDILASPGTRSDTQFRL